MSTEKQEGTPDCQRRKLEEFSCFRCHDGLTPLYCLNCAGVLLKAQLSSSESRAASAEDRLAALRTICGTSDANRFETALDRANQRAASVERIAENLAVCAQETRNAAAACFRVLEKHDLFVPAQAELLAAGVKAGFGVRVQQAIDALNAYKGAQLGRKKAH